MAKNIIHRKNGTYCCIVYVKDPLTGKTRSKWRGGFSSEKEAEKERVRWMNEINENRFSEDADMKLSIYLASWLELKKKVLKPGTYQGYLLNIEKHINPNIGSRRLKEITPTMLEKLYDRLSKIKIPSSGSHPKYLSNSSIRYVHATLRAALNDAVKKRILNYNPCLAVTLAPRDKYEARTLTREEIVTFFKACVDSPIGMELLLMLMLGLRRGEALGLRFSDVDFAKREAHIQQQFTTRGKDASGKQQWGFSTLKTKESDRIVGIPTQLIDLLAARKKAVDELKARDTSIYHDHDLICCNDDGSPKKIVTIEHAYKRLLEANGLPNIRLHDLRHTYATQLLDLNVDLKSISQALGHTSIKTTADIYIGKNNAAASRTAAAFDTLFSQVVPSSPMESDISNRISTLGKVLRFKQSVDELEMKKVP